MNWEVANLLVVVGSWFIIWFVVGLFQRKSFLRRNKMFKVGDRVLATGIYRSGTSCAEEVEVTVLQVKNRSSFPYRVEIPCDNCLVELWLSAGNIKGLARKFKVGDYVVVKHHGGMRKEEAKGRIIETDGSDIPYKVHLLNPKDSIWREIWCREDSLDSASEFHVGDRVMAKGFIVSTKGPGTIDKVNSSGVLYRVKLDVKANNGIAFIWCTEQGVSALDEFKVGDRIKAIDNYYLLPRPIFGTILETNSQEHCALIIVKLDNGERLSFYANELELRSAIKPEPFKVGDRVAAAAKTKRPREKGMLGTVTGMPSLHEGGKVTRYAVIWDELPHDWFAPWAHDQEKLPRYKADQLVKLPAEPEFKVGETAARVSADERFMVKRCMVKAIRFVNGSFCYCYEEGNSGGWVDETMLRKVQPLKAAGPKFGKGLVVLAKPGNIEVWVQVKEIAHKADGSWEYEVVSFSGSSSKIVPECWLKQKPTCQEHSWLDQAPPPLSDDPGLLPPASAKALNKVQADVLQGIMDALPRALKSGGIEHLPGIVAKLVDKAGSATSPGYTNLAERYYKQEAQQSLEKRQWAKKIQMAEEGANEAKAELAAMRERIKKWIEEE